MIEEIEVTDAMLTAAMRELSASGLIECFSPSDAAIVRRTLEAALDARKS